MALARLPVTYCPVRAPSLKTKKHGKTKICVNVPLNWINNVPVFTLRSKVKVYGRQNPQVSK